MPGYITTVLHKYNHPPPDTPKYSPHIYSHNIYGATHIYSHTIYGATQIKPIPESIVPTMLELKKKRIQKIIGSLLFYARAVDPTILPALNDVAADQSGPTILADKAINQL